MPVHWLKWPPPVSSILCLYCKTISFMTILMAFYQRDSKNKNNHRHRDRKRFRVIGHFRWLFTYSTCALAGLNDSWQICKWSCLLLPIENVCWFWGSVFSPFFICWPIDNNAPIIRFVSNALDRCSVATPRRRMVMPSKIALARFVDGVCVCVSVCCCCYLCLCASVESNIEHLRPFKQTPSHLHVTAAVPK